MQELNNQISKQTVQNDSTYTPQEMAELLSAMNLSHMVVAEIHQAVVEYTANGYDEFVSFKDIIAYEKPGVDDPQLLPVSSKKSSNKPKCPLFTEALVEYLQYSPFSTNTSVEEIIELLKESELELYWPYSEMWDGNTMPTYAYVNSWSYEGDVLDGYDANGQQVSVDEAYAKESPVFVVRSKSRNSADDGLSDETDENLSDWEEGGDSDDDQHHRPVDGGNDGGGGGGWVDPGDGDPNNSVTYRPMYYKYKLLLTDIQVLKPISSYPWWKGGMEINFYNFAPQPSMTVFEDPKSKSICKYTFDFTKSQIERKARYRLTDAARNDTLTIGLNGNWTYFQNTNRFVCIYNDPYKASIAATELRGFPTSYWSMKNGEEVIEWAFGGLAIKQTDVIIEDRLLTFSNWNDVNKRYVIIADGMFKIRVEIIETPR